MVFEVWQDTAAQMSEITVHMLTRVTNAYMELFVMLAKRKAVHCRGLVHASAQQCSTFCCIAQDGHAQQPTDSSTTCAVHALHYQRLCTASA